MSTLLPLRRSLIALPLLLLTLPLASLAQLPAQPPVGMWDGSIKGAAGDVEFRLEVKPQGDKLAATLINASDRQPFTSAAWDGKTLTLRFDYYDGTLAAHYVAPDRMEGEYSRQTSRGMAHIPVTLVPHREVTGDSAWTGPTLTGTWVFHRPSETGAEKSTLAEFQQQKTANADGKAEATGIFEPVSGDTGLLHGYVYKTRFHLSRFDGIHVLAFDGDFQPDGSLKGQIGSGLAGVVPFTATRTSDTAVVDPNAEGGKLTRVTDPQQPFRFSGTDATGKTVDQNSPEFKGKAVIVDIFGTWCPNCHDEAPVLEALYRKYQAQGLEIVALAYEYTDDAARNQRLMSIYRDKYGLTFPMLLAGTTADGQIAKTLPQLVDFGAFPTTIFLDRTGRVHAIHAGFSGPSTGEKYKEVQQQMDQLTQEILKQ